MWLPLSRIICLTVTVLSASPSDRLATRGTLGERLAGDTTQASQLRALLNHGLDRLDADLRVLGQPKTLTSATKARTAFRRARQHYKQIEGLVEFYGPSLVTALNGPGTTENDDEPTNGRAVITGFPQLESLLFPHATLAQLRTIPAVVSSMRIAVQQFRKVTSFVTVTNVQRLEIARTEIARVSTLGIAGFDASASGDGIVESAAALEGTRQLFPSQTSQLERTSARAIAHAITYLRAHPSFNDFDRFTFLTQYANPAAHAVGAQRRAATGPQLLLRRVWRLETGSAFDANAMDAQAYAPAEAPRPTPALVALGRTLFFDPVLSGNGARACASCHRPNAGFRDSLPRARPFGPGVPILRRTPSIINAAYQPAQFVDERVASLEQQIAAVLASPAEMHSSLDYATHMLRQSGEYREQFGRVFAVPTKEAVTAYRLQIVLAAYVRSLTAMHSRFDRAMQGEPAVLRPPERHGFNLFMGKARCGTCHFAPFFNGTAPPGYLSSEVEVIGVPESRAIHNARVDADSGRAAIDHLEGHLHAFKTPTVRNVTLSNAFMHNGAFRSLKEVVDFYNRGGGNGIGAHVSNATLPDTPLHLSAHEQRDLIAFLGALIDTTGLTDRPRRLPRFEHSKRITDRPIGGVY